MLASFIQCCESGSVGSVCFWPPGSVITCIKICILPSTTRHRTPLWNLPAPPPLLVSQRFYLPPPLSSVFGPPGSFIICTNPDLDPYPSINKQKRKKTLNFYYILTFFGGYLSLKTDVLQKVISKTLFKKICILSATDEKSRIRNLKSVVNQVYLLILVSFLAPGSGSAFLVKVRIQESQITEISVDPCGSNSESETLFIGKVNPGPRYDLFVAKDREMLTILC
jgi:hypothetical protein